MSEFAAEGAICVTIRPEQIQVLTTAVSEINLFPGRVVAQRFTGTQRRVTVAIAPDLHLQAWIAPSQTLQNDQPIWVSLPPAALWCFPSA
jgi:TOBE domain